MPLLPRLVADIRARGPLTVAAFMERALYDPEWGYYTRAAQRSGREGDFYTSVDVGPLFGALVAAQLAEMWDILRARGARTFDVVEAGAGNGRLARDVLDAMAREHPGCYAHLRLTLVERSAAAREAQPATLGPHARLAARRATLPAPVTGVMYANELLDALPIHVVTVTPDGPREIAVTERGGALHETLVPISTTRLHGALCDAGAAAHPGDCIEIGLAAEDWITAAAEAIDRGFLLLFDYGTEGSPGPAAAGTLTAYRGHAMRPEGWLEAPGEQDLTAHVNLPAVRRAAARAGLVTLGVLDQTYFLLGLGLADRLETGQNRRALSQRLAARTLIMPGGLGSTMKAMVFAKNAGAPALRGTASGRLT